MVEFSDSELVKKLVRDGLRGQGAGTPKPAGMKSEGSAMNSAPPQGATAQGGQQPMAMLMRKRARLIRHSPFLMIIDGGLA